MHFLGYDLPYEFMQPRLECDELKAGKSWKKKNHNRRMVKQCKACNGTLSKDGICRRRMCKNFNKEAK